MNYLMGRFSGILSLLTAAAFLLAACQSAAAPDEPDTVIYLVRHAEKTKAANDPALSPAGAARAQALVERFEGIELTHVYSTSTTRTLDTAGPVAESHGLPIWIYDGRALEPFAETLKSKPGRILVVGHSNTTPQLAKLLGGDPGEPINEAGEYDRLYIVTPGTASALERYGQPYVSGK